MANDPARKWKGVFVWIPVESVLYQNRPRYYKAIEDARHANDSGVFIEFTLSMLYEIIAEEAKLQDNHQVKLT